MKASHPFIQSATILLVLLVSVLRVDPTLAADGTQQDQKEDLSGSSASGNAASPSGLAGTQSVCPSGCTYSSIQAAIDAAASGDTIQIGAGIYPENLLVDKDLVLQGSGASTTIIDGGNAGSVITIDGYYAGNHLTVQIAGVRIQNGFAPDGNGGGINNDDYLTILDSEITNNKAGSRGGGVYSGMNGTLSVSNTLISGNEAAGDGGGIYVDSFTSAAITDSQIINNMSSWGGAGMYTESPTDINSSVFAGNTSNFGGGGMFLDSTATLTNVTVSGNESTSDNGCGGGMVTNGSSILNNVTISNNTASEFSGLCSYGGGAVETRNTILDHNVGGNCYGEIASHGNNLDSDGTCGFAQGTDLVKIDPLLGPLQDNGGGTLTQAPQSESPVIDAGSGCAATDQRGETRPVDGNNDGISACDIGAYENTNVVSPSGGPLTVHTFTIDDDQNGPSSGDGDEIVEAGETVELTIELQNLGTAVARGVEISISTSDPYSSFSWNTPVTVPDIPGGNGTRSQSIPFEISLHPATPAEHVIEYAIQISSSNGGPWTDQLEIVVGNLSLPPGDNFSLAEEISTFPWSQNVNVARANNSMDDPLISCINARGHQTLWYQVIIPANGTLTVDTRASSYDTVLAIWQGTRGSLVELACNDDFDNTLQSKTQIPVSNGDVVYVEAVSYHALAGGTLKLNVALVSTDPPKTFHVSPGGDDHNSCLTSEDACKTIQKAVNKSLDDYTVIVAPGTYLENILIQKDIVLHGSGKDLTIIDGNANDRVMYIKGSHDVHLLGMTIQNGHGVETGEMIDDTYYDYGEGGGIRQNGGSLSLADVNIINNISDSSGGGLYLSYGVQQASISNSSFSGNKAGGDGGGLFAPNTNGGITVMDSLFSNNTAFMGGGLMSVGGINLTNTTFQGNTALDSGGAIANGWGWGGWGGESPASLTIHSSKLNNNSARYHGGAIYSPEGTFAITDTEVAGNSTLILDGGAIYASLSGYDPLPVINNSCIYKNSHISVSVNSAAAKLDAAGNWWGKSSGPSFKGPGAGDSVNEYVDFNGFKISPILGCGTGSLALAVPGAATPLRPRDIITTYEPEYVWNLVPGAHAYLLKIKDNDGKVIFQETYEARNVCVADRCSITPAHHLPNGKYAWSLRTSNTIGNGVTSIWRAFTVTKPTAVQRYVSKLGDDGHDCLSMANACATINGAIAKSTDGDVVQVLEGTYFENVVIDRDINILGENNSVVIDGGGQGRVVAIGKHKVSLVNLTLQNGAGESGGGLFNEGTLTVQNCIIQNNSASSDGGGLFNSYEAEMWIEDSLINDNSASSSGGGAMLQGKATFTNTVVENNTANMGGGIYTHGGDILLQQGSSLLNNISGGIMNWWSGKITLKDTTVAGNYGHGVYNGGPYAEAYIMQSTISDNTSSGVINNNSGIATIQNSTISRNGSHGIETNGGESVTVNSATIAFNSGNGIYNYDPVYVSNTILASNSAGNCDRDLPSSLGHNLDSGITCKLSKPGDMSNTDPLLGPLQDNGGYTFTHNIDVRSKARDSGDDALCLPVDQRGELRPVGNTNPRVCDIGAVENNPPPPGIVGLISPPANQTTELVRPIFQWEDVVGPAGATAYQLQIDLSNDTRKTYTYQADRSCDRTTCTVKLPVSFKNTHYAWRVRAVNPGGQGLWSPVSSFTVNATVPASPTLISPKGGLHYGSRPVFTWEEAHNAATYQISVYKANGQILYTKTYSAVAVCADGPICTARPDTALPATGQYKWAVRAANAGGYGDWTPFETFDAHLSVPSKPTILGPINAIDNTRPIYHWETAPHAQQYQIRVKTLSGKVVMSELVDYAADTARPDFRLEIGQTYLWQLRGWNPNGWGAWSTPVKIWVAAQPRTHLYVSSSGSDLNSCTSSLDPCKTLQGAINKSGSDDIIHVASGSFVENILIDHDLTLSGAGTTHTVIDGNSAGSVISVCGQASFVVVENLAIMHGLSDYGGGISFECSASLTLDGVELSSNSSNIGGGGIASLQGKNLKISRSTIKGNSSGNDGGGIYLLLNISPHPPVKAVIESSTISENQANMGMTFASGGGIFSSWPTFIINSTISGNRANLGGGICPEGEFEIMSSTIAENGAYSGGGISRGPGEWMPCGSGSVTIQNSIIAKNWAVNAYSHVNNCEGRDLLSKGNNIENENECGFSAAGDMIYTDPLIGPLQDNGGPTLTHALAGTSPAVDTANTAFCPKTDQRGLLRPQDGDWNGSFRCDMGAFELEDQKPEKPVGISPISIAESNTPRFTWHHEHVATDYQLFIYRKTASGVQVIGKTWYSSEQANCTDDEVCEIDPGLFLRSGEYYWKVRGKNLDLVGGWSNEYRFTSPP